MKKFLRVSILALTILVSSKFFSPKGRLSSGYAQKRLQNPEKRYTDLLHLCGQQNNRPMDRIRHKIDHRFDEQGQTMAP